MLATIVGALTARQPCFYGRQDGRVNTSIQAVSKQLLDELIDAMTGIQRCIENFAFEVSPRGRGSLNQDESLVKTAR